MDFLIITLILISMALFTMAGLAMASQNITIAAIMLIYGFCSLIVNAGLVTLQNKMRR